MRKASRLESLSLFIFRGFYTHSHTALHSSSQKRSLAVALVGFCAFLNLYTPQPLLPLLQGVFGASELEASLLVSAATMGVAISAPWGGAIADQLGRKRVITPALAALTVPTLLATTATDLSSLVFWRFLQGILMAVVFAVSIAYISEESTETGVGRMMALYITGNVVGGFAGRFLAGLIVMVAPWQWAFGVMGGLTLMGAIAVSYWLPPSRTFKPRSSLQQSIQGMRSHIQNLQLLAAYAVGFNILFSLAALFTYVNFYLAAPPFRLNSITLGSIFCVYLVGAVITPIAGQWIEFWGYRRSLLMAIGLAALGAGLTLTGQLTLILTGLALSASGIFICQSISTSYVGTTARIARSSATGLYVSASYLGGSMGAMVPGYFWGAGGWTSCVLLVLSVQLLAIYLVLVFWKK